MICGYNNIYELCSNKYSYQYKNVIFNSDNILQDDGPLSVVIRTDNTTGEKSIIGPYSETPIDDCDLSAELETISEWGCYQIFRGVAQGYVNPPDIETYRETQIANILQNYNNILNNGIQIAIDNRILVLSGSLDDQISYRNTAVSAQTIYNNNPDNVVPSITDINKTIYKFNYSSLNTIFQEYFRQIIYYKNIKDFLITKVNQSTTIDEINSNYWNINLPIYATEVLVSAKVEANNSNRAPCINIPVSVVSTPTTIPCDQCVPSSIDISVITNSYEEALPDWICDSFTAQTNIALSPTGTEGDYTGTGNFSTYPWGSYITVNMSCQNNGYFYIIIEMLIGCHDPSNTIGMGGILPGVNAQALCGQNWQGSLSGGISGGGSISFTVNGT